MIPCNVANNINITSVPDLLKLILSQANVSNIRGFLNPTRAYTHDAFKLKDMDKAIDLIYTAIKEGIDPLILPDIDADGYTSGAMIYNFFTDRGLLPGFIAPLDKQHGITPGRLQAILDSPYQIIVIPDGSSSDIEQCKALSEAGKKILILDHHAYDKEEIRDYAVLVNCTDGCYPNTNLSGAGVVQKTIEAFYTQYGRAVNMSREDRDKFLDLCAVGMIADAIDLTDLEARFYATEGLKFEKYNNECLNELCEKVRDAMPTRTIHGIGFNVAPMINGVCRYGKPADEKKNTDAELNILFRALVNKQEIIEYQPRRAKASDPKPPIEYHTLQTTAARLASNALGRQRTASKKLFEEILTQVDDTHKVILVDVSDIFSEQDAKATGLVANQLMNHFGKPAFVINKGTGSCRSNAVGRLTEARTFFNASGFIDGQGHPRAFGIKSIDKENFLKFCDENIMEEELANAVEVDFVINPEDLRRKDIEEICKYLYAFGNTITIPRFYIPGIKIRSDQITGTKRDETSDYINSISLTINGVECRKKYCKKIDFDAITCSPEVGFGVPKPRELELDLICSAYTYEDDAGDFHPMLWIDDYHSESLGFVKEEIPQTKQGAFGERRKQSTSDTSVVSTSQRRKRPSCF